MASGESVFVGAGAGVAAGERLVVWGGVSVAPIHLSRIFRQIFMNVLTFYTIQV